MDEPELESTALAVPFRVCPAGVLGEVADGALDAGLESSRVVHEIVEYVSENMMNALRDDACGHRHAGDALGHLGAEQ